MCRKENLLGFVLLALGVGFLLSCIIGSLFWRLVIGCILMVIGLLLKKC